MRLRILLPVLLLAACAAPDPDMVRFEIGMSGPEKEGWLDPATTVVGLRGSAPPLSWSESLPLTDEDGDGVWVAEVHFGPDAPGIIQYKVFSEGDGVPNGGWERGDNRWLNRETMPIVRRDFEDSPEPIPASYTGTVEQHRGFGSGTLVGARDLYVWLPPGYDHRADRRYPVLYLHDGQNVFDQRAVNAEWGMDETATDLIEAGTIEPIIIVGVANTADRLLDYTPTAGGLVLQFERSGSGSGESPLAGSFREIDDPAIGIEIRGNSRLEVRWPDGPAWIPAFRSEDGWYVPSKETYIRVDEMDGERVERFTATNDMGGGGGQDYARFLVEEVKPFIDSTYSTLPGREDTSVGGSSLGGLISMSIGTWYPDVFGGLLVVSPSVWWGQDAILGMVLEASWPERPRVWLDIGTAEGPQAVSATRELKEVLLERGWVEDVDLVYVEDVGAPHNEDAWAARADGMLRFLYEGQ